VKPHSGLYSGGYKKEGTDSFIGFCCDSTWGNGFRLKEGGFSLDIRRKFFTVMMVRHWNRLPRGTESAPSLETLKVRLDGAPSNLI